MILSIVQILQQGYQSWFIVVFTTLLALVHTALPAATKAHIFSQMFLWYWLHVFLLIRDDELELY